MSRFYLLTAVLLMMISSATAQPASVKLSMAGGLIRNLQDDIFVDKSQYSFYPEVQISSKLSSLGGKISLEGGLHWGYWNDGVQKPSSSCADCITYSYSSHIVGARLYTVLEALPIPLSLLGGLSHHFLSAEYIGGRGVAGRPGNDFRDNYGSAEVGLRIAVPLSDRLTITTEVQEHIPLSGKQGYRTRPAFKLGFSFSI